MAVWRSTAAVLPSWPTRNRALPTSCVPASRRCWYETVADGAVHLAADIVQAVALLDQLPVHNHGLRHRADTRVRGAKLLRYVECRCKQSGPSVDVCSA